MLNNLQLADACIQSYNRKTKSDDDVEFLYIDDPDHHVIVIRGTEAAKFFSGRGWMDVARDLAIWPKSIGDIKGHAGFVQGWNAIEDEVLECIEHAPNKPIVLTGHSLGGAIALVGAYALIRKQFGIAKVVTFGAPRALIRSKRDPYDVFGWLGQVTTQYEHSRDPVPGFLRWTSYRHVRSVFLYEYVRAPWFKRKMKYHWMTSYKDLLSVDDDLL